MVSVADSSTRCRHSPVPNELLPRVPTPCIGVCSTGVGDAVCRGCKRFSHEVIHWNSYTEAQKRLISARLDQFLTQIVSAKLTVFDEPLLIAQLQRQQVRYSAHMSPAVWVFELLRAGARQIDEPRRFGFEVDERYRALGMAMLREHIDREFFILSEAHYQCYIDPRYTHAVADVPSECDAV